MSNKDLDISLTPEGEVSELPRSMQLYQAIYKELTGKSEKLVDNYSNCIIVELSNIVMLRQLFVQHLEQYTCSNISSSITFFHQKSSREQLSSFERINTYNVNNNAPIERINIEINFFLVLPKTNKPQPYKITINIISGAAIFDGHESYRMHHKIPGMVLVKAIQHKAIESEIEYVDYVVARGLSELIKEWVGGISEQVKNEKIIALQDKSRAISVTIELIFTAISIVTAFYYAEIFITNEKTYTLAQFLICASFGIFSIKSIGNLLGRSLEFKIDSMNTNEFSIIHINAGDKKLHNKMIAESKNEKISAVFQFIYTIIIAISCSIAASFLFENLKSSN